MGSSRNKFFQSLAPEWVLKLHTQPKCLVEERRRCHANCYLTGLTGMYLTIYDNTYSDIIHLREKGLILKMKM